MLGSSLPMALISIMLIICIIGNVGALQCYFGVQDNNKNEVPCNPTFHTSCEKAICELGGEKITTRGCGDCTLKSRCECHKCSTDLCNGAMGTYASASKWIGPFAILFWLLVGAIVKKMAMI